MSKLLKTLPKFTNEHEERTFWEQEDSTEYLDLTTAKRVVLPNLKPSTKTISRYGCRKNYITIELTGGSLVWVS